MRIEEDPIKKTHKKSKRQKNAFCNVHYKKKIKKKNNKINMKF